MHKKRGGKEIELNRTDKDDAAVTRLPLPLICSMIPVSLYKSATHNKHNDILRGYFLHIQWLFVWVRYKDCFL